MLKLIIKQTNWGIIGSIFAFTIGFFVKTYVIREVGTIEWGRYATAHTFTMFSDTLLSLGIPFVILKFFPTLMTKSRKEASFIVSKILRISLILSFIFLSVMYFLAPILDQYIYVNTNQFSYLLLIISIHAPISIFMGIITSLYRSVLKIKEIILYGTFIGVTIRAFLTFIIFYFSNDILSFVIVEIFTQLIILFLMFYFFNKNELKLFSKSNKKNYQINDEIYDYGKRMYVNSIVLFLSGQSLSFILGIMLPPSKMGVYSILLTITGVSLFLNKNLRKIFAPIISKLYTEKKISQLNILYKRTTFIRTF